MINKCTIETTKRNRVKGKNGPTRKEMKAYGIVDSNIPEKVIQAILSIANNYTGNDLGGDNYQISQHCDIKTTFTSSSTYSQILLQQLPCHLSSNKYSQIDEKNYLEWREDIKDIAIIKTYLNEKFKKPYRTRISVMEGGNELNYHIDTDTSVLCRIQIPVKISNSKFQWKIKEKEISLSMKRGNAYFINTGWLHRVINPGKSNRIVLIFGIDYYNIPYKETLLKIE